MFFFVNLKGAIVHVINTSGKKSIAHVRHSLESTLWVPYVMESSHTIDSDAITSWSTGSWPKKLNGKDTRRMALY